MGEAVIRIVCVFIRWSFGHTQSQLELIQHIVYQPALSVAQELV